MWLKKGGMWLNTISVARLEDLPAALEKPEISDELIGVAKSFHRNIDVEGVGYVCCRRNTKGVCAWY